MTIQETVIWFNSIYELNRKDGESKGDFTCFLTFIVGQELKGVDTRKCLGITKCDSTDTAEQLMASMEAEGYSVGRKEKEDGIATVCLYRKETPNN